MLLAAGLTGQAQTAARHWLREGSTIPKDDAARLVSTLSWRGISRIPLSPPARPDRLRRARSPRRPGDAPSGAAG